jgi:hypothetical protein
MLGEWVFLSMKIQDLLRLCAPLNMKCCEFVGDSLCILIPALYSAHFMQSVPGCGLECVQNIMCLVYISVCVHMTYCHFLDWIVAVTWWKL